MAMAVLTVLFETESSPLQLMCISLITFSTYGIEQLSLNSKNCDPSLKNLGQTIAIVWLEK